MIFLDTNAVIAILNKRPAGVGATIVARMAGGHAIAVSSIVLFELRYGIAKGRHGQKNAAALEEFLLSTVVVVPFDQDDAAAAGEINSMLRAAGTPIGPYDVLIAGQVLRCEGTLVTANTREFARVPGLELEDWGKG